MSILRTMGFLYYVTNMSCTKTCLLFWFGNLQPRDQDNLVVPPGSLSVVEELILTHFNIKDRSATSILTHFNIKDRSATSKLT